jgi:Chromosome segregation ATPases
VQELDARLKETGYSSVERQNLEADIRSILERTRARLDSRATLLEDITRSISFSGKAPGDFSSSLLKTAEELKLASGSLVELGGTFDRYREATPSFLDEFLSPEGIITRKRSIDADIGAKLRTIETLKASIDSLGEENRALSIKIEGWRKTLEDARLAKTRVQTQMAGAEEALAVFRREIAGQEATLRDHEAEVFAESRRAEELRQEIAQVDAELAEIEVEGKALASEMDRLEKAIAGKNEELGERRKEAGRLADRIQAVQSELETIHLSIAQNGTEIKNIKENFLELYSRDLGEYEERMFELRSPVAELRERLSAMRTRLKDLGSVNLMAPEEYKEVKERYDFLSEQMADLVKARDDLKQITDEIRNESAELFLDTYNKIKKNFHNMFRRLFGGGRAELRLSDSDHVLESGIEILAQPPGKKLEVISLLSGGGKNPHRDRPAFRHLYGKAFALLFFGRNRRRPGRGQCQSLCQSAAGILPEQPVHRHNPQQEDGERRRYPPGGDNGRSRG